MTTRSLVGQNLAVLFLAVAAFLIAYSLFTGWRNDAFGRFYDTGRFAEYDITGPLAEMLQGDTLRFEVTDVTGSPERSTLRVTHGEQSYDIIVATDSGKVVDDPLAEDKYLIFYYDCPIVAPIRSSFMRNLYEEHKQNMAFHVRMVQYFTPFSGNVRFEGREFADTAILHDQMFLGPQFAWRLFARNRFAQTTGEMIYDQTSGLLLEAKFYERGALSTLELKRAQRFYPCANRYAVSIGLNAILLMWGAFHLRRLKKHPEARYFNMSLFGGVRFYLRIVACTTFGALGAGSWTGALGLHVLTDLVGFVVMLIATGPYALLVLFKFVGLINGVQYPFAVPLYLCAAVLLEVAHMRKARRR